MNNPDDILQSLVCSALTPSELSEPLDSSRKHSPQSVGAHHLKSGSRPSMTLPCVVDTIGLHSLLGRSLRSLIHAFASATRFGQFPLRIVSPSHKWDANCVRLSNRLPSLVALLIYWCHPTPVNDGVLPDLYTHPTHAHRILYRFYIKVLARELNRRQQTHTTPPTNTKNLQHRRGSQFSHEDACMQCPMWTEGPPRKQNAVPFLKLSLIDREVIG